ncbi:MAG: C4-type zinc ribbon domain-containing protein [Candidatus Omnitrophota bacterium]
MAEAKTIGEQLSILKQLQELDLRIYALERTKREKPLELEVFRKKRDAERQSLKDEEKQVTELQVQRKNKEIDLESKEGVIKKYQIQLYQVKTNKEYQSLQKEIETLKADNSVLEEDILKVMDQIDRKKGELARRKETLTAMEAELAREEDRIGREIADIEKELLLLGEKRQGVVPALNPKLYSRYDRILIAKEGLALVPVKGHSCGGCHIHLPPQVINEVQLQEKIIICENCSRILYLHDEISS